MTQYNIWFIDNKISSISCIISDCNGDWNVYYADGFVSSIPFDSNVTHYIDGELIATLCSVEALEEAEQEYHSALLSLYESNIKLNIENLQKCIKNKHFL